MKMVHVFNTANDAYNIALGQRAIGVDAHLIIDETHSIFSFPGWQELGLDASSPWDSSVYRSPKWKPPSWIHTIRKDDGMIVRTTDIFRLTRGYDILQAYPPSPIYLQMQRTPYVVYECGWMRRYPYMSGILGKLGRRGYSRARAIIHTNPDLFRISDKLDYLPKNMVFIPFAVDISKYTPLPVSRNDGRLVFFCPSRANWELKGTDKLIKAFVKYHTETKRKTKPVLYFVKWGTYLEQTQDLISALPRKIRRDIRYLDLMSKDNLIKMYHMADVVCDQFTLGSYGTSAPEAMACGRPVLMYLHKGYNRRAYGAVPPIANAYTIEQIVEQMHMLEDYSYRKRLGELGRRWIVSQHAHIRVAKMHQQLYEEIL